MRFFPYKGKEPQNFNCLRDLVTFSLLDSFLILCKQKVTSFSFPSFPPLLSDTPLYPYRQVCSLGSFPLFPHWVGLLNRQESIGRGGCRKHISCCVLPLAPNVLPLRQACLVSKPGWGEKRRAYLKTKENKHINKHNKDNHPCPLATGTVLHYWNKIDTWGGANVLNPGSQKCVANHTEPSAHA